MMKIQEYVLDRIVVMGLDAVHFLRLEREIEKFIQEEVKKAEKKGEKEE